MAEWKRESDGRIEELERLINKWVETLEGTIGTHIRTLIAIWGETKKSEKDGARVIPTSEIYEYQRSKQPEGYEHHWSWRKESHWGGHSYVEMHKQEQRIYDEYGYFKGTIETEVPVTRYMEPYTQTNNCDIRVNTDKNGIITHIDYVEHSPVSIPRIFRDGSLCSYYFLFPEDFQSK
jgi:hypothetical protein